MEYLVEWIKQTLDAVVAVIIVMVAVAVVSFVFYEIIVGIDGKLPGQIRQKQFVEKCEAHVGYKAIRDELTGGYLCVKVLEE